MIVVLAAIVAVLGALQAKDRAAEPFAGERIPVLVDPADRAAIRQGQLVDGGMMTANVQAQAVAQREMMAQLYLPRFLRAGDRSSLRATVQNLTEKPLSGKAKLEVFDALRKKNPAIEKLRVGLGLELS